MSKHLTKAGISILQATLIVLFISMAYYFVTRAVFIAFASYTVVEKVLAIIFFFAELFILFQAVGFFCNVLRLNKDKHIYTDAPQISNYPTVAVFIPARHEPKEVLFNTVATCYNMTYPNKEIYILDDSSEEQYKREAREIAAEFGVQVFSRNDEERHGAKAGIVNDCMKQTKAKYVAIFDCDQNPMPGFLYEIVPMLEAYSKLALVQTPQFYINLTNSRVAYGSQMQQAVFYEYVCEGKSSGEAMICCGTNVVIRADALNAVGGFDEDSVTEDFATSFRLHVNGWETTYVNKVRTFGMGPEDLGSYFKQQFRWAIGNVGMIRKFLFHFFRNPVAMHPVQWFEYFVTSSYYLIGWAYVSLIFCPLVYLFFDVPSYFMNPVVYTVSFFPYLLLSYGIYCSSMLMRQYSLLDMGKGYGMFFITLPVYLKASLFGMLGVKTSFQVTGKGGGHHISYRQLWPQLLCIAICFVAIVWGFERLWYERSMAVIFNLFWMIYHLVFFLTLFYYNEDS